MNELNNYEQRSSNDVGARRGALVATAVYAVVMLVALCFTRCDVGSPEEELQDAANMLLISFGDSDVGSDVLAHQEMQQVVPPRPITPQIDESAQLTDEQSEVEIEKPKEVEQKPETTVEREKPKDGDSIPQIETPQVNKRALFPGSNNKASDSRGDEIAAAGVTGTAQGTTEEYSPLGEGLTASYSLSGRSLIGNLPAPTYRANAEGRVVIAITVDDKGRVTTASMRSNGTTTNNSSLIEAARIAALKARFTPSEDFLQQGTITYIFRMN